MENNILWELEISYLVLDKNIITVEKKCFIIEINPDNFLIKTEKLPGDKNEEKN